MLDKFSNYKRRILSRPKILSDNIWWLFILISIVFITVYFLKRLEHSSLLGSAFFLVALLGLFIILKKPFWGLMATYLIYSFNLSSTTEEHVIGVVNIDTTANMDVTLTVQWASADVANIFDLYQAYMGYRN